MFQRTGLLVGPAVLARLAGTRVLLFGVGGVGSWCAEALIRSGVGHLAIVDSDCVCVTNVNRQVQALPGRVGRLKVEELAARLREINPSAEVVAHARPYGPDTRDTFAIETYDYVLDAIDSLSPKLGLIEHALLAGRTLFGTMGASAKLDPTKVRVASIWETAGCPLARRIRKRLRHHGITTDFKVVHSEEMLLNQGPPTDCGTGNCLCPRFATLPDGSRAPAHEWCSRKSYVNGSVVMVTAAFGMALASLVVNDVVARVGPAPVRRSVRRVAPAATHRCRAGSR
jgi:tRNA A37 threonylcarbamoyladenosine dehydratase